MTTSSILFMIGTGWLFLVQLLVPYLASLISSKDRGTGWFFLVIST